MTNCRICGSPINQASIRGDVYLCLNCKQWVGPENEHTNKTSVLINFRGSDLHVCDKCGQVYATTGHYFCVPNISSAMVVSGI